MGIMTAAKYVDTRAYNVWKTWAKHVPGKVLFFVAEHTESIHADLPLIRLKGVDDTYPPQKKSFAMVKWMAENYLDEFDWFLRADDDLYVRGNELESFCARWTPPELMRSVKLDWETVPSTGCWHWAPPTTTAWVVQES